MTTYVRTVHPFKLMLIKHRYWTIKHHELSGLLLGGWLALIVLILFWHWIGEDWTATGIIPFLVIMSSMLIGMLYSSWLYYSDVTEEWLNKHGSDWTYGMSDVTPLNTK